MARQILGKVAITPKGEYNNATTYVKLDVITYQGSSYTCLKNSIGNLPTNTEYWQLVASKGEAGQNGENGQDGHTPVKGVDYFTTEDIASLNIPTKTSDITNDSGFINNSVNNLVNYELKTNVGHSLNVSIDSSTFIMTIQLKNSADEVISTQTVDLPLETMVVGASYDSLTKEIVLTLKNGTTTRFSVADLVNGLQSEITSTNKLDASLVDDTLSSNKFVTSAEKTTWNDKLDASDLTDYVKNTDYATNNKGGVIKINGAYGVSINSSGEIFGRNYDYSQYNNINSNNFVSKGTLENVIAGKQLVNQTYVDNLIGNINTVLASLTTPSNNGGGE